MPAEAMQQGVTAVSTDWSATAEFLERDTGWPAVSGLVPARDETGRYQSPGAVQAGSGLDAAASGMQETASCKAEIAHRGGAVVAFAAEACPTDRLIDQLAVRRSALRAEASEGAQRQK